MYWLSSSVQGQPPKNLVPRNDVPDVHTLSNVFSHWITEVSQFCWKPTTYNDLPTFPVAEDDPGSQFWTTKTGNQESDIFLVYERGDKYFTALPTLAFCLGTWLWGQCICIFKPLITEIFFFRLTTQKCFITSSFCTYVFKDISYSQREISSDISLEQ